MSFGIARGKQMHTQGVELDPDALPPFPDNLLESPEAARVRLPSLFPNPELPIELEIGSGKGTFLVQQASRQPDTNFLGIEYAREFFNYAADRVRRHNLTNVRMLCADAAEFVRWRTHDASIRVLHLYFPDPWPKKRHHKKRMVQDWFLTECARILTPNGELRVVTDHPDYWSWMQDHFARFTRPQDPFELEPFSPPDSAGDDEVVGTNFERKYRDEGRTFNAAVLRKH